MRPSNRLLAILDTLRDLARNGWVFAACAGLIAAAVLVQARAPRATYRAMAMLELAPGTTGELPSAAMIQDAMFHRATSDERPAACVVVPKGKTNDRTGAGLFAVECVDENPQRAVDLANAFAALAVKGSTSNLVPNGLDALQQRVQVLRAHITAQAGGFQSDLRARSEARRQLRRLKAALAKARSRPAEIPSIAKRQAKIARLKTNLVSKRRAAAALTARIEAARDQQSEFATAVVNLDAVHVAPRAVAALPAVASVPTGRRPVWLPLVAPGLIIAALGLLLAASWRSYHRRPVLSEADLRAVAPVPVLVSIPEIRELVPPHARRWPFVTNAVFTALSLVLLAVILFRVMGR